MLIAYDDSYVYAMRSNGIDGSLEHRFEQMLKLASVPFKQMWNITIDATILPYQQAFGSEPYANSCPYLVSTSDGETVWNLNGQCRCVDNSECYIGLSNPGHHNSGNRLVNLAHNYAINSNVYDVACIFVGYHLCITRNGLHGSYAGLGARNGNGFAVCGSRYFDSNETTCFTNLLSSMKIFIHELSHNYGLTDGGSSGNCTENYPCMMTRITSGYYGVVYVGNAWCPSCLSQFNYSRIGSLVEGSEG